MTTLAAPWWRVVRFGFRLLYNEMAFTYDAVADVVSLGQWWAWQRTALDFLPPPQDGPLLELAHGTGRFALSLQHAGYRTTHLDLSPAMGRITGRRLRRAALTPRLVRGDGGALPFPDEHFASIVSTFPTPFIVQPKTLAEIARVLRPDGRVVMVVSGLLVGGSVAEAALEGAYAITGQRGGWGGHDLTARAAAEGLALHEEQVRLARSVVLLLTAQRTSRPVASE
ncbi:MAG: class I SAM-dependent methyltransferase [Anaerolineales bacterium]